MPPPPDDDGSHFGGDEGEGAGISVAVAYDIVESEDGEDDIKSRSRWGNSGCGIVILPTLGMVIKELGELSCNRANSALRGENELGEEDSWCGCGGCK